MTQPCSGFDAAVSYLCIQIENRMYENHTSFDEMLGMIMKTEKSEDAWYEGNDYQNALTRKYPFATVTYIE